MKVLSNFKFQFKKLKQTGWVIQISIKVVQDDGRALRIHLAA